MNTINKFQFKFLIFALILMISACESDEKNRYFEKKINFNKNDYGLSSTLNENGEIVICGHTNSIMASNEIIVTKLSATGNICWTKTFGNFEFDMGTAIINTSDQNLCLSGTITINGNSDIFILKLNQQGQLIWSNHLGGLEINECHGLYANNIGGCYIIGSAADDMLLYNISITGNILWTKSIGKFQGYDFGRSIFLKSNGNLIISGNTNSFTINQTPFITELNTEGDEQWTSIIKLPYEHFIYDMTVIESDGIYLVGGYQYSIYPYYKALMIKTDLMGNLIWQKQLEYPSFNDCYYDIESSTDSCFILTGYVSNDSLQSQFFVFKTTRDGTPIWSKNTGKALDDIGYSSKELPGGDIYSVGVTEDTYSKYFDILVLKMNKNGKIK